MIEFIVSDNLEAMAAMPDNSFDSCLTDPPYGISFMNKKWDYQVPSVETWAQVYRLLKPGAFMLVACGTRTHCQCPRPFTPMIAVCAFWRKPF
jgi:DNA modification methylase